MKYSTEPGEMITPDIIRQILREHASRENPIGITEISRCAKNIGYSIGKTAIEGFMTKMQVNLYETEEECDEIVKNYSADMREIYFCKMSPKGKRTKGYWMMETLSETEWMFLMDSVLNSKILNKKEADNLAKRVALLAGKKVSELMKYRYRMEKQLYFVGDDKINENSGHIESKVLGQVRLVREAIEKHRKVKFTLCVYDYAEQQVRLVPYGKHGKVLPETPDKYKEDVFRIVSPFDVIYSGGRYYMLGADLDTERNPNLKYKLYRIDLMDDLTINRAVATTKEQAGIQDELINLFKYRVENPYMFTGKVEKVYIRVDADQFTQIVDWFSDSIRVVADKKLYYDIEVNVNLASFTFWVLQYSGCVEVLSTEECGDSYRNYIKETLRKALKKYEEE